MCGCSRSSAARTTSPDRSGTELGTEVVPKWYHGYMALNVRIPDELDARLEVVAAAQHVSKSALLLQGATLIVERHARQVELNSGLDFVLSHDAELLKRLEDA